MSDSNTKYADKPIIYRARKKKPLYPPRPISEFTREEIEAMKNEYASGVAGNTIARKHAMAYATFRGILINSNYHRQSTVKKLTTEERECATADYLSGMTMDEVAARYGVKDCSIWEMLRSRGLSRSNAEGNRRYELNENAFDEPLTPEKLYWLGFMMTDGFVSPRNDYAPTVGVALSSKDLGHLGKFVKFLGTNQKIYVKVPKQYEGSYNSGEMATLQVRSHRLAEQLISYGVVPNKTKTAQALRGIESSADFWRGCVDGDGSVCLDPEPHRCGKDSVRLCGASRSLLEQFGSFCRVAAPGCLATVKSGHHTYGVIVAGRFALQLANVLYANTPSLDRKLANVNEMRCRDSIRKQNRRDKYEYPADLFLAMK